jgi:hypothetical protein
MPHPIPDSLDALLTRDQNAEALTAAGFPVKPKTLATKASRGGGPPFQKWSGKPLYRWGDSLGWAHSLLTEPRRSTSEPDVAKPVSAQSQGSPTPAAKTMAQRMRAARPKTARDCSGGRDNG